jgi:methylmalonyl-CoA/ethylmalonyl-CoA epimerase
MFAIKKIDHVAVCVPDIDAALARYAEVFGLVGQGREASAELETEAVLLPIGDSNIELISPHGPHGPHGKEGGVLSRFLEKRGPGLHHIALSVENLDGALAFLTALGVPLVDASPKVGARGHRVAFIHPKATGGVLVELVES